VVLLGQISSTGTQRQSKVHVGKNSGTRRQQKLKKIREKHRDMSSGPTQFNAARKRYVKEWEITSTFFQREGHYAWMASQVSGNERVLEIGCGIGFSTLAKANAGHCVVVVEENPRFIDSAKSLLEQNGFTVSVSKRGLVSPATDDAHYSIAYSVRICDHDIAGEGNCCALRNSKCFAVPAHDRDGTAASSNEI
jgi:2-polyprenyl-3-methyl-5-hydroxy-6-metoxy-1,4-benzoquinol methylase